MLWRWQLSAQGLPEVISWGYHFHGAVLGMFGGVSPPSFLRPCFFAPASSHWRGVRRIWDLGFSRSSGMMGILEPLDLDARHVTYRTQGRHSAYARSDILTHYSFAGSANMPHLLPIYEPWRASRTAPSARRPQTTLNLPYQPLQKRSSLIFGIPYFADKPLFVSIKYNLISLTI